MLTGEDIRLIGIIRKECDNCGRETWWTIYEKSYVFGLLGIIIFRFEKRYHRICKRCGRLNNWISDDEIKLAKLESLKS